MRHRTAGAVAVALLACAGSLAAQEQRSLEVGGFLQWTSFDNSLRIDDFFTPGGMVHVPLTRSFGFEADIARAVTNGPPTIKVTYLPLHARLVYSIPVQGRASALIGAGYVHSWYGASRDGSDGGVTGIAGLRFRLTDRIAARFDFLGDYMPSPVNEGPTTTRNWNLGIRQGLSFALGRSHREEMPMQPMATMPVMTPAPTPVATVPVSEPDSDNDGVSDTRDRCPATAPGTAVDSSGCPLDSDGDGVPDRLDRCPNTAAGTTVDASGCVLDSDHDGVPDTIDRCPGTAAGTRVDASGCLLLFEENKKSLILEGVNFANGKAELTPESKTILDNVASSLLANPAVRVLVEGHTSSTGTRTLNLRLSQARAEAVKTYLAAQGVTGDRLVARGFGPDRPIASNTTADGQAKNRRVELVKLD